MEAIQKNNARGRDNKKVLIVGGSAAGLYTAAKVAGGGKRVRVLESRAELEPASRTLIVTSHFRTQLGSAANESVLNEIRRFELFTDGRSEIDSGAGAQGAAVWRGNFL